VLGEAEKPGSYTVSGLSTMTNALFASGGVKKIGSLRKIELKRNGRLVTVLDLYDLLLHGDTRADQQLMPGDVIFIPPSATPYRCTARCAGRLSTRSSRKRASTRCSTLPAALCPTPTENSTIGAYSALASARDAQHRFDVNSGRSAELANGDKLRVPTIRPTLENSVVLSGYVFRPGSFEYRAGLRLSDILPSFDELRRTPIATTSWCVVKFRRSKKSR